MKKLNHILGCVIFCLLIASCQSAEKDKLDSVEKMEVSGYPITPVNIQNVRLTDEFWLPIVKNVQENPFLMPLKNVRKKDVLVIV